MKQGRGIFRVTGLVPAIIAMHLFFVPPSLADIHYVSLAGHHVPPFDNWQDAATDIQSAIDVASGGDEVVVSNGTYLTGGKIYDGGSLTNRVVIDKAIRVRSLAGPDETCIQGASDPATGGLGDNAIRCVWLGAAAILDGFTLTNGYTRDTRVFTTPQYDKPGKDGLGGGIFSADNSIVTNCHLFGCRAASFGGGMHRGSAYDCLFDGNFATFGGGISYGVGIKSDFVNNIATNWGGGGCESTFFNSVFRANTSKYGGAGCYVSYSDCTVSNNRAVRGGGAYLVGRASNSLFIGNHAEESGGAATEGGDFDNCRFFNNIAISGGGALCDVGTVNNCWFFDNVSCGDGGAIRSYSTVYNSIIYKNRTLAYGGGAAFSTLRNCTIIGNETYFGPGGTYNGSLYNCIIYYNKPENIFSFSPNTTTNSCTFPLSTSDVGNITNAPQLSDLVHLSADSACRSSGNIGYCGYTDIDNEAWLNPPSIGCDQYATPTIGRLYMAIIPSYTAVVKNKTLSFDGRIYGHATDSCWTFGDGTPPVSNISIVAHAWKSAGTYEVRLTAYKGKDDYRTSTSVVTAITVHESSIKYVNASNATPEFPYTNWITAATSIQDAIDACLVAGSTVIVTNGIYDRGGHAYTEWPLATITSRVVITNGISVISVNGPAATFIVGGKAGPVETNGPSAVRGAYMGHDTLLAGFTVMDGHTDAGFHEWTNYSAFIKCSGGGIFAETEAVISNCWIVGNTANAYGGGVFQGRIIRCVINENETDYAGGGVYRSDCLNSLITKNRCNFGNGNVYAGSVLNCTIAANTGGGLYLGSATNCIIYFNGLDYSINSPVYKGAITYSCTFPLAPGDGNITNAPQFVDVENGDYHLQAGSPCIDAGIINDAPNHDLEGVPRPLDGNNDQIPAVDIGAYEFTPGQVSGAHYASLTGGHHWPYTNWVSASTNIQMAIDAAAAGDTVFVAPGTYFITPQLVVTQAITLVSANGPGAATLDGLNTNRCMFLSNINARVEGFKIIHGQHTMSAIANDTAGGGGVYCAAGIMTNCEIAWNSCMYGGFPNWYYLSVGGGAFLGTAGALHHCNIHNNTSYGDGVGGGVAGCGELTDSFVASNSATMGGGVALVTIDQLIGIDWSALTNLSSYAVNKNPSKAKASLNFSCPMLVKDCAIIDNIASSGRNMESLGGGVLIFSEDGSLRHTLIAGNTSTFGGGIVSLGGLIENCEVRGNRGDTGGGILTFMGSHITRSIVRDNSAYTAGGALIDNASIVDNSLFAGNVAGSYGGGIVLAAGGTILNCTLVSNCASNSGGGLYCETFYHGYPSVVSNTIVYFNSAPIDANCNTNHGGIVFSHSCMSPYASGVGNITNDPQFVDTTVSDYRIQLHSPCLNAGSNMVWMRNSVDLSGNPRIINGVVDIGAYEYSNNIVWLSITGAPGTRGASVPYGYGDHAFFPATVITSSVPVLADVSDGERYVCGGWRGSGSVPAKGDTNIVSFTIETNSTLEWQWLKEYLLTTTVNSNGTVNPLGGWLAEDSSVIVTAIPDARIVFAGWTGDVPTAQTNTNPLMVKMDRARTIQANFDFQKVWLTIVGTPFRHGIPTPHGYGTHSFLPDTAITDTVPMFADVVGGRRFVCGGWRGTGSAPAFGDANTVAFTIKTNTTLEWRWLKEYRLTATVNSNGTVKPVGGWLSAGSAVVVTAMPYIRSYFSGWTGDVPLTQTRANPLTLTMDQARTIQALFTFRPFVAGDYNWDGVSDMAVYQSIGGKWFIMDLTNGLPIEFDLSWGSDGGIPVTGDYDGDKTADLALYYPVTGAWYIRSLSGQVIAWGTNWGFQSAMPVSGDYNGDGKSDLAVFSPDMGQWFIRTLDSFEYPVLAWHLKWGFPGCVPVSGDFDGDGCSDLAVYDRNSLKWYIRGLHGKVIAWGLEWGFQGAIPLSGDYDGDGNADLAVYDPRIGVWYIWSLKNKCIAWSTRWGFAGAIPVAGDYDGDGRSDLAVYYQPEGLWYIRSLSGNILAWKTKWGWSGAMPVTQ